MIVICLICRIIILEFKSIDRLSNWAIDFEARGAAAAPLALAGERDSAGDTQDGLAVDKTLDTLLLETRFRSIRVAPSVEDFDARHKGTKQSLPHRREDTDHSLG